jgi:hypothetical protein
VTLGDGPEYMRDPASDRETSYTGDSQGISRKRFRCSSRRESVEVEGHPAK